MFQEFELDPVKHEIFSEIVKCLESHVCIRAEKLSEII